MNNRASMIRFVKAMFVNRWPAESQVRKAGESIVFSIRDDFTEDEEVPISYIQLRADQLNIATLVFKETLNRLRKGETI